jgi:hypothetical protein
MGRADIAQFFSPVTRSCRLYLHPLFSAKEESACDSMSQNCYLIERPKKERNALSRYGVTTKLRAPDLKKEIRAFRKLKEAISCWTSHGIALKEFHSGSSCPSGHARKKFLFLVPDFRNGRVPPL